MRIDELQQRENFLAVLADTLAAGWSVQHGGTFFVSPNPIDGGQEWLMQPILSVVTTRQVSRRALRFAADGFRYTNVRWRMPLQWLLGTALASRPGIRLTSQSLFWVDPELPGASDVLILPGNRRVRTFDFSTGTSRVFMKAGYDPQPNLVEIGIRGSGAPGPYAGITRCSPQGDWFEEPLVAGFTLARCPPWRNRGAFERKAFDQLAGWLGRTTEISSAAAHLETLEAEVVRGGRELEQETGRGVADGFTRLGAALGASADRGGIGATAITHGDFQPGNVLIEVKSGAVYLTDWEFSARRFREYDFLVWGLRSRSPVGFAGRVLGFLGTGDLGAVGCLLGDAYDRRKRIVLLSRFLLEELSWQIADNLSGGKRTLSASAIGVMEAAEAFTAAISQ